MNCSLIDPTVLAERVREIVGSGEKRKYYRFRPAPFYAGIATADCVGCCLKCHFCWSWHIMTQPEKIGRFYSPEEVARNLLSIAGKKGFNKVRMMRSLAGGEPIRSRQAKSVC